MLKASGALARVSTTTIVHVNVL